MKDFSKMERRISTRSINNLINDDFLKISEKNQKCNHAIFFSVNILFIIKFNFFLLLKDFVENQ